MKIEFVRKFAIGMVAVSALSVSAISFAGTAADKSGYLLDSRGNVVRNSYNECWRTGYWTPELAIPECDPDLFKKGEPEAAAVTPPVQLQGAETPAAKPLIKVNIAAAAFFDFDKSIVKPEGKKLLDEQVVAVMQAHPEIDILMIVGHTDRIGTAAYNRKLSERRAAAGKAYLVQQGIPAERIRTAGKGKSEPDMEANTRQKCKGVKGRNKLIACLQPDRRIVIESQERAPAQ